MRYFTKKWGRIEVLLVVANLCVLLALLVEPVKWASDGDIRLPVKIFVFDAFNCRPIPNAECLLFRALPVLDASNLTDDCPNCSSIGECPNECRSVTDATGFSVIEYKFHTSASDKNPITRAHLTSTCVRVEATGFGGVVVPLRYEGRPTSELRKEGKISVSLGLIPAN
jgi:hypothetical protein